MVDKSQPEPGWIFEISICSIDVSEVETYIVASDECEEGKEECGKGDDGGGIFTFENVFKFVLKLKFELR
jgi:hypothetical protein